MLGHAGFRKYFTNTSWLFIERVVRLLVVLGTGILVARYLGPELFGQLNYATGFVGIFFALTTLGLDEIIVRDLVKDPGKRNELLGTAAVLKFAGSLVLVMLVAVSALVKDISWLTASMILIIASSELLRPFMVVDWYYMANVRSKETVMVQMAQVMISAAAKIILVIMKADLIWFAWVYVLEGAALGLGYVILYASGGETVRAWRYTKKMAGYLLGQSWPLIIYGMALYVQAKIDQVMIFDVLKDRVGESAANAEVGQYSNALKMIEALGFLPVIIQKSLAPAITRAHAQSPRLYADRLLNQYRLMFVMFLATSVPLFFFAEPLMVFLFGEEYRPSGFLLKLFAIRLFFTNMGVGKTSFITNESLFKYSLITAVVGAVLNIVMNWFLIPEFQSIGALWATIGSFTISIFMLDLFFKNTRRNFWWMMKGIGTFWRLHRFN
jgi:O-antigen/teichoic acid export membrane protein